MKVCGVEVKSSTKDRSAVRNISMRIASDWGETGRGKEMSEWNAAEGRSLRTVCSMKYV